MDLEKKKKPTINQSKLWVVAVVDDVLFFKVNNYLINYCLINHLKEKRKKIIFSKTFSAKI